VCIKVALPAYSQPFIPTGLELLSKVYHITVFTCSAVKYQGGRVNISPLTLTLAIKLSYASYSDEIRTRTA
jgi:hypothetical protein